jgi:hypothetical protein
MKIMHESRCSKVCRMVFEASSYNKTVDNYAFIG